MPRMNHLAGLLIVALSLAGCIGPSRDDEGKIVDDVVQFTADGRPHCPFCGANPYEGSNAPGYSPGDEGYWDGRYDPTNPEARTPFRTVCQSCGQAFRWQSRMVPCWQCDGERICPECGGQGQSLAIRTANGEPTVCWRCDGTGRCDVCVDPVQPYDRFVMNPDVRWSLYPPQEVAEFTDLPRDFATSPWQGDAASANVWDSNGFIRWGVSGGEPLTYAAPPQGM